MASSAASIALRVAIDVPGANVGRSAFQPSTPPIAHAARHSAVAVVVAAAVSQCAVHRSAPVGGMGACGGDEIVGRPERLVGDVEHRFGARHVVGVEGVAVRLVAAGVVR